MTENDYITWRMVTVAYPAMVQRYVQENGPLPDGPVKDEDWNRVWEWWSNILGREAF